MRTRETLHLLAPLALDKHQAYCVWSAVYDQSLVHRSRSGFVSVSYDEVLSQYTRLLAKLLEIKRTGGVVMLTFREFQFIILCLNKRNRERAVVVSSRERVFAAFNALREEVGS